MSVDSGSKLKVVFELTLRRPAIHRFVCLTMACVAFGCARAESISLAATMDRQSFLTENAVIGGFAQISQGDGTLGGLANSVGDADGWYDLDDFGQANPQRFAEADFFPREENFLVGSITFDASQLRGEGIETVRVDSIDLAQFWSPDLNRTSQGGPATVITDFSDRAIGLIFFGLGGGLAFGDLDADDTVSFADGVLTSINIELLAQFILDFNRAGPTAWEGTFSIFSDQLAFQISDTQSFETLIGIVESRIEIGLTGKVDAVGGFTLPRDGLFRDSFEDE